MMENNPTHSGLEPCPEVFTEYIPLPFNLTFQVVSLVGMRERFATLYRNGVPWEDAEGQANCKIFEDKDELQAEVERLFRELDF